METKPIMSSSVINRGRPYFSTKRNNGVRPHLFNFEDCKLHRGCPASTRRNADEPIQPAIALRAGFEARRGAHVVERGIDRFSGSEAREHVRRAMAVPEVAHIDERSVVGLEGVARIELCHAV